MSENLPNTIRHIAGWGLVKGPDKESIMLVRDFGCSHSKLPATVSALLYQHLLSRYYWLNAPEKDKDEH